MQKTETERWVAIPGTSEHQLGLGVDINADGINQYGYEVYNQTLKMPIAMGLYIAIQRIKLQSQV